MKVGSIKWADREIQTDREKDPTIKSSSLAKPILNLAI